MRTRDRATCPLAALALTCACATNPTPSDRIVTQEQAVSSGKGAYAFVRYDPETTVAGELIASANGHLIVLTEHGGLVDVPFDRIADVTLGVHDNDVGAVAAWTVLGSVSTLSHGYFLIFSLPVWLASGIGATANESHRGLFVCPSNVRHGDPKGAPVPISMTACLGEAAAYARFPQGLPRGVGAKQLLGLAPVAPPAPNATAETPARGLDGGVPLDATRAPAVTPYDNPG